jgi:protein-disulfide isomerase
MDSGRQLVLAAAIVGVAVIAGSLLLARSLDRVTQQLDGTTVKLEAIRGAVADAKDVLAKLPTAAPARAARSGPDPNKRYKVNTKGRPARGPANAAITVVEFSDFQ